MLHWQRESLSSILNFTTDSSDESVRMLEMPFFLPCIFLTNFLIAAWRWLGVILVYMLMSFITWKSLLISSVNPVRKHSSGTRHNICSTSCNKKQTSFSITLGSTVVNKRWSNTPCNMSVAIQTATINLDSVSYEKKGLIQAISIIIWTI